MICEGAWAYQQAEITFNPEAPLSPLEQQPGEIEAYAVILDQPDLTRRMSRINRFMVDYPTSEFRHLVLRARWEVRVEQGDLEAIMEAAEEGLAAQEFFRESKLDFITDPARIFGFSEFSFEITNQKAAYYQSIMETYRELGNVGAMLEYGELGLRASVDAWNLYEAFSEAGTTEYQVALEQNREMQAFALFNTLEAYEGLGDVPRIIEYSEKILELIPDDLQMLMKTALTMAEASPPEGMDPGAYWQRATQYAEHALEQLDVYFSGTTAAYFDGARLAAMAGEVHSTLGRISYELEDWPSAADSYSAAIEAVPDEPMFYAMLGLVSRERGDVDGYLSAYARAEYLDIPRPQVRAGLETIYEAVNGSLDGLDEFIQSEGTQTGSSRANAPERTAYIDDVIDRIDVLETVFPPNRFCYQFYELLASQDLRWATNALEIGVGSGVNSLILLDQGVGRVIGTDVNENAIKTFEQNAAKFGYTDRVEGRLVSLDRPEAFSVFEDDETFDLIISNPPWEDNEPKRIAEYAYSDSGWVLLRSMLEGFSERLNENGKVWLLYGDPRVIPTEVLPAIDIIMREAPGNNLTPTLLYSNARCSIVEIVVSD